MADSMTPEEAFRVITNLPAKVQCGLGGCQGCRRYWTVEDFEREPERKALLAVFEEGKVDHGA